MMVPGCNLLSEAFALIGTVLVEYHQYNSRTLNDVGQWVTSYDDPVDLEASVQAPDRDTYVQLGLDMQKNYMTIFVSQDTIDLSRDVSGDQFKLGDGRIYQLESEVPWFLYDGWVVLTAVEVKNGAHVVRGVPKSAR